MTLLMAGSCEQNALLACADPQLVAVSAMFPRSPLALLCGTGWHDAATKRVGAHVDTVEVRFLENPVMLSTGAAGDDG